MKLGVLVLLGFLAIGCVRSHHPSVHIEYMEKETVGLETRLNGGHGTGFFVSTKGYIVTAAHVIKPTNVIGQVYVRLKGPLGPRRPAKVIAVDYKNDLALLKVSPSWSHRAFKFCDRPRLHEYVKIEAFRHPEKERTIGRVKGYLGKGLFTFYADAPVDYGFSGSPVVAATRGCVIGVLQAMSVQEDLAGRLEFYSLGRHPRVSKIMWEALKKHAPESLGL